MSVVEVFVFLIGRQRPMLAKPRLTFIVIIRDDGRITVKHQVCDFLEALPKDSERQQFSKFQKHFYEFLPI